MDQKLLGFFWSVLRIFILITIIWLVVTFLISPYKVNGSSMEPTLFNGSTIIGTKYEKSYKASQLVIYKRPGRSEVSIGRIIAIPGDTVLIKDGLVLLNNLELEEIYLDPDTTTDVEEGWFTEEGNPITVPPDTFYIMGDNRSISIDSRQWGFVPKENIEATFLRCALSC